MMPGRLYLKIFASFIGVLILTLLLVAGMFRAVEGEKFKGRFKRFAKGQTVLLRTIVEDRATNNPDYRQPGNDSMSDLLAQLSVAYDAKIWLTGEENTVLAQSFPGPLPTPEELWDEDDYDRDDVHDLGSFQYRDCEMGRHCIYVTIPFGGRHGLQPGTIHFVYSEPKKDSHEEGFFVGLFIICSAIALLIMPVSWLITRRLKDLRSSALQIAEGDLSHRAEIKGKDEVAGVGRALNRMADSLSRMIRGSKELTANVSHELRTPLTRIRIAEEMLREQLGEDGLTHLDSIREDVDELDKLIGKLLTLSKLDLKEDALTMESVDIADLTRTIVDRLTPIAEHKGVTMQADLPDTLIIEADGEALHTGLGNILENGVKHALDDGWLNVEMTTDENTVTISVENSHAPLPGEELETIFEPFRRAKGTVNQGFGLGLAIARKIVERHGGTVHAENCPGGVRFVVILPKASA